MKGPGNFAIADEAQGFAPCSIDRVVDIYVGFSTADSLIPAYKCPDTRKKKRNCVVRDLLCTVFGDIRYVDPFSRCSFQIDVVHADTVTCNNFAAAERIDDLGAYRSLPDQDGVSIRGRGNHLPFSSTIDGRRHHLRPERSENPLFNLIGLIAETYHHDLIFRHLFRSVYI